MHFRFLKNFFVPPLSHLDLSAGYWCYVLCSVELRHWVTCILPIFVLHFSIPNILFLDFGSLTVDELMKSKVEARDGCFICIICKKSLRHTYSMKRHMRDNHLSSNKDYQCPECNIYLKSRRSLHQHLDAAHEDLTESKKWKCIYYGNFVAK